jgi:hypothetical protein
VGLWVSVLSPCQSQAANIVLDTVKSELRIEGSIELGDAERFQRELRGKVRLVLYPRADRKRDSGLRMMGVGLMIEIWPPEEIFALEISPPPSAGTDRSSAERRWGWGLRSCRR